MEKLNKYLFAKSKDNQIKPLETMQKRTLIIGATGNVGKELVKLLPSAGIPFILGVRNVQKAKEMFEPGHTLVPFDYDQQDTYKPALEEVEKLFMVAPPIAEGALHKAYTLIDAAQKVGIKHLVFISASAIEVDAQLPLGQIEKYITQSSLPYTILRPTWFMQNFSNWAATTAGTGAFYLPAGEGKAAFIDTRDIAMVAAKVLADGAYLNQTLLLTGPQLLNHNEVAQAIGQAIGRQVAYIPVKDEDYIATLIQYGQSKEFAEFLVYIFSMIRDGKEARNTTTVEEIIGRKPVSITQYAQEYAHSWK